MRSPTQETEGSPQAKEAEKMTPTLSQTKSFIDSYIEYASDLTDAPEIYHKTLALNLLSLAVGRTLIKISTEMYPNLDIILVGLSGLAKKSTAMKLSNRILPEDFNMLPNDFTPESLLEALEKNPQGLIHKDEIGGFLESIKKKDYMSGTADLLCQLYDCLDHHKRLLRSHEFNLKDVCFNLLGATTPSRFLDTLQPSDFNSGFLARPLIVFGVKSKSLRRRRINAVDTQRKGNLEKQWKRLFEVFHGKQKLVFEFEDSALDYVNNWCEAQEEEVTKIDDIHEADLKGAISVRSQDQAFKLAALFEVDALSKKLSGSVSSVSKLVVSKGILNISLESAEKACSIIDYLLTQLTNLLTNILTHNDLNSKLSKLTNTIKNKAESDGWVQHRTLLQHMNCTADLLRTLLQTAQQRDLIETKTMGKATYYKINTSPTIQETQPSTPISEASQSEERAQFEKIKPQMFPWCLEYRKNHSLTLSTTSERSRERSRAPLQNLASLSSIMEGGE